MKNKKGFEMQFNWIFVLVAGMVILLFFTMVVVEQKGVSETTAKATVLKSMESIIVGAGVSADTTVKTTIPKSEIAIDCGRISIGTVNRPFQNMILFAPQLVKGDIIVTQTQTFSIPYKVANLLDMSSTGILYIIIGKNELASYINSTFPKELTKEQHDTFNSAQINAYKYYEVRFAVFGTEPEIQAFVNSFPQALKKMPDVDVTAVVAAGDLQKGQLDFYTKKNDRWGTPVKSSYVGLQSLMSAFYVDSADLYTCSMDSVFAKLNLVNHIYTKRTQKLMEGTSSDCNPIYASALATLSNIDSRSKEFNKQNALALPAEADNLKQKNKEAERNSCPSIY